MRSLTSWITSLVMLKGQRFWTGRLNSSTFAAIYFKNIPHHRLYIRSMDANNKSRFSVRFAAMMVLVSACGGSPGVLEESLMMITAPGAFAFTRWTAG
jgi:hypothetical protein